MASTIIGLFKGKPKAATPAPAATPQKGPIITQLGGADQQAMALRRKLVTNPVAPSLFGQSPKLGG